MTDLSQSARSLAALRSLRDRLAAERRYLDARYIRRHFCWPCDKSTVLQHHHTFKRVASKEWRA